MACHQMHKLGARVATGRTQQYRDDSRDLCDGPSLWSRMKSQILRSQVSANPRPARVFSRSRSVAIVLSMALGVCALLPTSGATQQTSGPVPAEAQERSRLLELQRTAVAQLQQATREGATADLVKRALLDASQALEMLAAAPAAGATGGAAPAPPLPPALRSELHAASTELTAVANGDLRRVTDATRPTFALLDKVRSQLEGGRARAGVPRQLQPDEAEGAGVRRSCVGDGAGAGEPADHRTTARPCPSRSRKARICQPRTYCGGPTKDHILESACGGVALFDYDGDGLLDIYLVTGRGADADARAHPAPECALSQPRRMEVRGRLEAGGRGSRSLGQRRMRRRFRRRRASRSLRHELGPQRPVPQSWRRHVRGRGRRAGVAAGGWSTGCTFFDADGDGDLDLYVARYVDTTWDSVVHAQRTLALAQRAAHHGRPTGLPGESDLFFENVGNGRFVEATGGARPLRYRAAPTASAWWRPTYDDDGGVDLFVANDSNPNFLYHNLGKGRFESVGAHGRRGAERRRPRASGNGSGRRRLRRRFPDGSRAHHLRARSIHAVSQPRRPSFRGRQRGRRHRRADLRADGMGSGLPRRRSRWQARSVLRQRAHLSGHRPAFRSSVRPTVRRTSCC